MKFHTSEYQRQGMHDMPHETPLRIDSPIPYANGTATATLRLYLEPFHCYDYPGQTFYGMRLTLEAGDLQTHHLELSDLARKQAKRISQELQRGIQCDFSQISVEYGALTTEETRLSSAIDRSSAPAASIELDTVDEERPWMPCLRLAKSAGPPTDAAQNPTPPLTLSPQMMAYNISGDSLLHSTEAVGFRALTTNKRAPDEFVNVRTKRQRMSEEQSIAKKFGDCIRLAGERGDAVSLLLENWESDLGRLRPGDRNTTLKRLSAAQDAYTAVIVGTGIVAQMLQAWCRIAVEHEDRKNRERPRRSQSEQKHDLRIRNQGTLIIQIINELSTEYGDGAYKICAALAGSLTKSIPKTKYNELASDRLQRIAELTADDIVKHDDQKWSKLDRKFSLDPAAMITTQDFSYKDARRTLGLTAPPLHPPSEFPGCGAPWHPSGERKDSACELAVAQVRENMLDTAYLHQARLADDEDDLFVPNNQPLGARAPSRSPVPDFNFDFSSFSPSPDWLNLDPSSEESGS